MSRFVTGDHILFDECMVAFRPDKAIHFPGGPKFWKDRPEYIYFDFYLNKSLEFEDFSIGPTQAVQLPGHCQAFIAPLTMPLWFEDVNRHCFSLAVSAVLAFLLGRPVNSTRDVAMLIGRPGTDWAALAMRFPVLAAGPGSHSTDVPQRVIQQLQNDACWLINALRKMPYKPYLSIMQAIRLIHLAHLTMREDFALGYYLLISAIEAISQNAIEIKDVAVIDKRESEWSSLAETDPKYKEIFDAYRKLKSNDRYLKRRFIKFIVDNVPKDTWYELSDPYDERDEWYLESTGRKPQPDWSNDLDWQLCPENIDEGRVMKILGDAYDHRSSFTHGGENPPHKDPQSRNRFFECYNEYDYEKGTSKLKSIVVPTFRLMAFLATKSITRYIRELYS